MSFRCVRAAARRSENRAAVLVNRRHEVRIELYRLIAVLREEAAISERDAEDIFDAVLEPQRHDQRADDIIEAGAEAAACNNACADFFGIKINFFARAGFFEQLFADEDCFERVAVLFQILVDIVDDFFIVIDIICDKVVQASGQVQRGRDLAGPKIFNAEIDCMVIGHEVILKRKKAHTRGRGKLRH